MGINAVQLNGEGFIARIGQGQLLLEFDMDKIKAAGYSLETPVLITNHTDLKEIKNTNEAVVSNDVELIKVEKGETIVFSLIFLMTTFIIVFMTSVMTIIMVITGCVRIVMQLTL